MVRAILTALASAAAIALTAGTALAQSEPKGERVEVNGMKMYYEVSGEGDPLIVLHGSFMNIPTMGEIIPTLAETNKVYALELQGHGRTTDIDRPITYPSLADDVAAFMDAVGLEKANVLGYSMGAMTGLQLTIRHPEKVEGLIFVAGAYDFEGWQPAFKEFIGQATVEMFTAVPVLVEEHRRLSPNPNGFVALAEKLIQLEKEPMAWEDDVRAIKTPVLIITGDADGATLEHSVSMFRLLGGGVMGDMGKPLPESRLAVLPATSHTAVITQVDLLTGFIEPFLKGETPGMSIDAGIDQLDSPRECRVADRQCRAWPSLAARWTQEGVMAERAVCLRKWPRELLAVLTVTGFLWSGAAAAQSDSETSPSDTLPDTLTYTEPTRPWDEPEIPRLRPRWWLNQTFDAYTEALANRQPTIILFSARPCGFCKTMLDKFSCPELVRYAGFIEFAVTFWKEDDGGDHMGAAFNVQRFPTTIMLKTDMDRLHVIGRIEGVFDADDIDEVIQEGFRGVSGDMEMPDLLSVEETRKRLDEAGIARPSDAFCAGEEN